MRPTGEQDTLIQFFSDLNTPRQSMAPPSVQENPVQENPVQENPVQETPSTNQATQSTSVQVRY